MVEFGTPRHELILHQYDISPLTRKVKMALSIKGLAWRACTQPVIAPKPDLVALTRVAIAVFPCSRLAPTSIATAISSSRRGNTRALSAQRLSG